MTLITVFLSFVLIGGFKYLLLATDSSGRTANISYVVKIASAMKFFDVYFRVGFTNFFGAFTPNAKMLYTFVDKISKFIDPNDKVNILIGFNLSQPAKSLKSNSGGVSFC